MIAFSLRLPRSAVYLSPLILLAASLLGGTARAQDGSPPTTVVVIGESTLDADSNAGPRFVRINFDALSTASHTISVAWNSAADVRFNVFDETTGDRLNSGSVQGTCLLYTSPSPRDS